MQLIKNQILFKPFPSHEISESGLFIPENAREVSDRGIIEEVGNGSKERPMKLKKGDIAHRVHLWGEPVQINGETYYMMDEKAILALE